MYFKLYLRHYGVHIKFLPFNYLLANLLINYPNNLLGRRNRWHFYSQYSLLPVFLSLAEYTPLPHWCSIGYLCALVNRMQQTWYRGFKYNCIRALCALQCHEKHTVPRKMSDDTWSTAKTPPVLEPSPCKPNRDQPNPG